MKLKTKLKKIEFSLFSLYYRLGVTSCLSSSPYLARRSTNYVQSCIDGESMEICGNLTDLGLELSLAHLRTRTSTTEPSKRLRKVETKLDFLTNNFVA